MEIQNVKGVEIARVETVSACFSFLPRFSRGYHGHLARLSGLSAGLMLLNSLPHLTPSLRHWTLILCSPLTFMTPAPPCHPNPILSLPLDIFCQSPLQAPVTLNLT